MDSNNIELALKLLPLQLWNTIFMVITSTIFAVLIGLPLGIILTITSRGHIKEQKVLYKCLEWTVNCARSFPFAILMVALIPITRLIVGTSLGTVASIVPLTVAAAPFIARLVETSLKNVDQHMLEAAIVMGSNSWQIIRKVLLPEALPSLISDVTLTAISLIGYSAMAGMVGGGGLGQVAIQYGYNRFNSEIMIFTVILLICLVQSVQWSGGYLSRRIILKRQGHK